MPVLAALAGGAPTAAGALCARPDAARPAAAAPVLAAGALALPVFSLETNCVLLLLPALWLLLRYFGEGGMGSAKGSSSSFFLGAAAKGFFLRKGRKAAALQT